ncbi:MAG TPA: YciI family protein, partial [Paraburkholderia sp.]|nr:YciI family protein [Paraburkholderia sp.]
LIASMATYHEALQKAGVLLDASGLQPSAKGWRVRYANGERTITEGPFAGPEALIAGYTVIQVRSREEAMEWARRFPAPFGEEADGEIEVRQMVDLDDFEPSRSMERFRKIQGANH